MNWKNNLRLLSFILLIVASFMLIPTGIAIQRREEFALECFLKALAITWFSVLVFYMIGRDAKDKTIRTRDGYFFVTMTWVLATFFGCLPLYFSGYFGSLAGAYFEIMSGFTTTGATVLSVVEEVPSSILFWRSETNWLGGMGIVVLFVAIIPSLGAGGMKFFASESVGPSKDKMTPKSRNNAMILWVIYLGLSVLQVVFLLLGDLPLYDAICITFSTMSAAGFSVKNASIGGYNSAYVEWVTTIFMFLAGCNFGLFYKALCGRLKEALKDAELRAYTLITLVGCLSIAACLTIQKIYPSFLTALRLGSFQFISILTTTGFSVADHGLWPSFTQMMLFLAMLIGGCAGSTGGGPKVIRVACTAKLGFSYARAYVHPNGVFPAKFGDWTLSSNAVRSLLSFIGLYYLLAIVGGAIVSLCGSDPMTSLSASILCLGNIGLGIAGTGPSGNMSQFPDYIKVFLTFYMLIGRLELFTVLSLFTRDFWRR